jgi:hypothetical protein
MCKTASLASPRDTIQWFCLMTPSRSQFLLLSLILCVALSLPLHYLCLSLCRSSACVVRAGLLYLRMLDPSAAPFFPAEDLGARLRKASLRGDEAEVLLCLECGADVNHTSRSGSTALMAAAAGGQRAVVALLIHLGADVRATNARGMTALLYAGSRKDAETAELLIHLGGDPDDHNWCDAPTETIEAAWESVRRDALVALAFRRECRRRRPRHGDRDACKVLLLDLPLALADIVCAYVHDKSKATYDKLGIQEEEEEEEARGEGGGGGAVSENVALLRSILDLM